MMTGLILWVLLSQIAGGFPSMKEGTVVNIVLPDLVTVLATATVEDEQLVFEAELRPHAMVEVIISYRSNGQESSAGSTQNPAGNDQRSELESYSGMVSAEGDDVLIQIDAAERQVSLKEWLWEERGIRLVILPPREPAQE